MIGIRKQRDGIMLERKTLLTDFKYTLYKVKRASIPIVLVTTLTLVILSLVTVQIVMNKASLGLAMSDDQNIDTYLESSSDLIAGLVCDLLEEEGTRNLESIMGNFGIVNGVGENVLDQVSTKLVVEDPGVGTGYLDLDIVEKSMDILLTDLHGSEPDNSSVKLTISVAEQDALDINVLIAKAFEGISDTSIVGFGMRVLDLEPMDITALVQLGNRRSQTNFLVRGLKFLVEVDPSTVVGSYDDSDVFHATSFVVKYKVQLQGGVNILSSKVAQVGAKTGYVKSSILNNMGTFGVNTIDLDETRRAILEQCIAYSDIPYKMVHDAGCMSDPPQYLDCSAYVWKVFNSAGLETPLLVTREMYLDPTWVWIPASQAKPGDILLGVGENVGHTMVYAGEVDGRYYVFEARNPDVLSGFSSRSGKDWSFTEVKPSNVYNDTFYFYRHKDLM